MRNDKYAYNHEEYTKKHKHSRTFEKIDRVITVVFTIVFVGGFFLLNAPPDPSDYDYPDDYYKQVIIQEK